MCAIYSTLMCLLYIAHIMCLLYIAHIMCVCYIIHNNIDFISSAGLFDQLLRGATVKSKSGEGVDNVSLTKYKIVVELTFHQS